VELFVGTVSVTILFATGRQSCSSAEACPLPQLVSSACLQWTAVTTVARTPFRVHSSFGTCFILKCTFLAAELRLVVQTQEGSGFLNFPKTKSCVRQELWDIRIPHIPHIYRIGLKNRGHSAFPECVENYTMLSAVIHYQLHDFLHTSRSVYARYVYNVRVYSLYYIEWRHLVNLSTLDNAILKLKHNGLLTLTPTCAASNDLNPVYYAVWGAFQEMVYYYRSFKSP